MDQIKLFVEELDREVARSRKALDQVPEGARTWLQLNPLLATFIGDSRYNDRLPNSIGPEHRARVRALSVAVAASQLLAGPPNRGSFGLHHECMPAPALA